MVATSRRDQWNVLELSSFQLEVIETFRARCRRLLNVTPDHLDRHHTFDNYAAAKGRLFCKQQHGRLRRAERRRPHCVEYASLTKAVARLVQSRPSPSPPALWFDGETVRFDGEPPDRRPRHSSARPSQCRERHGRRGRRASWPERRSPRSPPPCIVSPASNTASNSCVALDGVNYYNDSKATNVDATLKAIDAFPGGLWIILGGKDKGSDYTPLARAASHRRRRRAADRRGRRQD